MTATPLSQRRAGEAAGSNGPQRARRCAVALLVCTFAPPAAPAEPAAQQPAGIAAAPYRAPADHPAPRRVGGALRDLAPALPAIAALVPDHLGMTVSEQPVLYWFIAAPTSATVEFTLIRPGVEAPLVERTLAIAAPGIQRIDLAALGTRLARNVEYEWSVALVADAAQRSRDVVAGGAIMRIAADLPGRGDAAEYATRALWYDALMALEPGPGASMQRLREARAALLEQAGLAEVAAYERRR